MRRRRELAGSSSAILSIERTPWRRRFHCGSRKKRGDVKRGEHRAVSGPDCAQVHPNQPQQVSSQDNPVRNSEQLSHVHALSDMLKQMPPPEPFRFQTRIRFIDTDASGRIHYTAMFRYFESAEVELLRTVGITYDLRRSYRFPRVHVECDFMSAIVHDDTIEIYASLKKLGRSSARFEFRTHKNGNLAAKGVVVIACVDRETERAVPFPDEIRSRLVTILDETNLVSHSVHDVIDPNSNA